MMVARTSEVTMEMEVMDWGCIVEEEMSKLADGLNLTGLREKSGISLRFLV